MLSVAIVTPSIGAKTLEKTISSVQKQTHSSVVHHIFADGRENLAKIEKIAENVPNLDSSKYRLNVIDENIGKGWYGHRVYAACSFLVNQDLIIYMDEDNWIDENHVETLVEVIEEGNDWGFSLRKIYDKDENFICNDNCESLGNFPVYFNDDVYHIDTSSFIIKKDFAVTIGHAWYGRWGADRQFFSALKNYYPNFDGTKKHTLCYRLEGNDGSVTKDFFLKGNELQLQKYKTEDNFPWLKKRHHVGPGISIQM
jgi:hypothetical protein